ncbi:MFS transporter [Deinococcus aquatilis]|uniref:MFS transporter n=1 Tax=Deinococcus aquatilis TaxID=519440 RepID=UPI0003793B02|nr:MFS transporter [Deinococcus aquatilis]
MKAFALFSALKNPRFARLYTAQAISQIGDALTWVGLALLAYQLAQGNAAVVLGTALTLRVLAFVIFSPLAGVVADRVNRKWLLISCDFGRVLVIACLPFVDAVWQVYGLMFILNTFTAFFTPTNQATVPLVMGQEDAGQGFALSSATTELINIAGPGLAGAAAALLGGRDLFFLDAVTFLVSGLLIMTLPSLQATRGEVQRSTWSDIRDGTARLWRDPPIRFALLMELVAAIAGALILVGTVTHVKTDLQLGDASYGWVMAAYGLGATLASLVVGAYGKRVPRTTFVLLGALVTSLAILPGNQSALYPLLAFWLVAGIGQNWVNLPAETLLAERTEEAAQGRVYGAHFAWSHLWYALAYPLAGFLGTRFPERSFLYGGLLALVLLAFIWITSGRLKGERVAAPRTTE